MQGGHRALGVDQPVGQAELFPADALPYFELPERFSARYDAFFASAKAGTGG